MCIEYFSSDSNSEIQVFRDSSAKFHLNVLSSSLINRIFWSVDSFLTNVCIDIKNGSHKIQRQLNGVEHRNMSTVEVLFILLTVVELIS
jgi:hypothetical protein